MAVGADCGPAPAPAEAYFGCADVKLGEGGEVRLLELGDGHTSAFTGQGAFIPERFRELGFSKPVLDPVLDAIVENKLLSHAAFVAAGFGNLRPKAAVFPMRYSPGLADIVWRGVGGGPCVLKLLARQRSCGVVVVGERAALDETLRVLLAGDSQGDAPDVAGAAGGAASAIAWAETAREVAARRGLEEHIGHWRADEQGRFLAEALCQSRRVRGPRGEPFDGTLRLGFALEAVRDAGLEDATCAATEPAAPAATCRRVHRLGAYWKLPDAAADAPGAALDERCISHTRGGVGTAPCAPDDEVAVWNALETALAAVLRPHAMTLPELLDQHAGDPLLASGIATRVAAGLADSDSEAAQEALQRAEEFLAAVGDTLEAYRARSYWLRTRGTAVAQRPPPTAGARASDWAGAAPFFDEALSVMPENAAAVYLRGMAMLYQRDFSQAAAMFARSLQLDADFAPAFCQLASCCLMMGHPASCVTVCEALLSRHMRLASAHQLLAAALYAEEATGGGCDGPRRDRAAAALLRARELQRGRSWSKEDDEMLARLESRDAPLPRVAARTWLFHSWRL